MSLSLSGRSEAEAVADVVSGGVRRRVGVRSRSIGVVKVRLTGGVCVAVVVVDVDGGGI